MEKTYFAGIWVNMCIIVLYVPFFEVNGLKKLVDFSYKNNMECV